MKAMILAAGRGERLRPLTETIPKPLIPISGEPLIVHQIQWLQRAGIREIVINVFHLAQKIVSALGSGKQWGVKIFWSEEKELLDTGGGIANALPHLGDEPFLLLNGDVWTSYRFAHLIRKDLTGPHLLLVRKPANKPHGDFTLVGDQVRRPKVDKRNLTYCGIGVFPPILFRNQPKRVYSLSRDILFGEVDAGRVSGEVFDGTWFDIGTPDQLKALREFIA